MVERPQRGERLTCRHLLGVTLGSAAAFSTYAVAEADLGGVFTAMPRAGGADDVVLRCRQEALLRHLLKAALVVVVRPRLHVDQAAAEQFVGGSVTLVERSEEHTSELQ